MGLVDSWRWTTHSKTKAHTRKCFDILLQLPGEQALQALCALDYAGSTFITIITLLKRLFSSDSRTKAPPEKELPEPWGGFKQVKPNTHVKITVRSEAELLSHCKALAVHLQGEWPRSSSHQESPTPTLGKAVCRMPTAAEGDSSRITKHHRQGWISP